MSWTHRVRHRVLKDEDCYDIVEYYFDRHDPDGNDGGWTWDSIAPYSDTLNGLVSVLQDMLTACDRPVLEDKDGK